MSQLLSDAEREQQEHIILLKSTRRKIKNQHIIVHNVFWAVWIGVIPSPLLDFLFMMAVQLKMISELSFEYNLKFSRNRGKAIITGIIGGSFTQLFAKSQIMKMIPGIGSLSGKIKMSIVAGAVTYAIGKVFERHLEAGGHLSNFDPEQSRDYFSQMYKQGEKLILRLPGNERFNGNDEW